MLSAMHLKCGGGSLAAMWVGPKDVRTYKFELRDWMLILLHYGIRLLAFRLYLV